MSVTRSSRRRRLGVFGAALAVMAAGWWVVASASIPTFTVTSTADAPDATPGDGICATATAACTLRAAAEEAATVATGEVAIVLPAGTIVLALGPLTLTGDVTITGAGAAATTIDAANASRAIAIAGGTVTLVDLTISGGSAVDDEEGGAINALDTALTLDGVTITGSTTQADGGGVFARGGSLTVTGSKFSGNTALGGGAIFAQSMALSVETSVFEHGGATNHGGAIFGSLLSGLTLRTSTFTDVQSVSDGGAVYLEGTSPPASQFLIEGCTFTDGFAGRDGGAVFAMGLIGPPLTLVNDVFSHNEGRTGGAVATDDASIVVTGGQFSDNVAALGGGGALVASGGLVVTGTTFTANHATGDGGAIVAAGETWISGATFSGNSGGIGGAIWAPQPDPVSLANSIFTGNTATVEGGAVSRSAGPITIAALQLSDNVPAAGGGIVIDSQPFVAPTATVTPPPASGPTPTPRPSPANLDPFMSYGAKPAKGTPFVALGPVTLPRLAGGSYDVLKVGALLLPADKNGEGRHDDATHLLEYKIKVGKGGPKFPPLSNVRVLNQCSDIFIEISKPVTVLVPTAKSLESPPAEPIDVGVDHFLCFQAKSQKKGPSGAALPKFPKGIQVNVVDQFQTRRYELTKVSKLCLPTAKSGAPLFLKGPDKGKPAPLAPASVQHANEHLVCYTAKLATTEIPQLGCGPATPGDKGTKIAKQAKHAPRLGVFIANQLGALRLDTTKEIEFCVPSFVELPIA